jgi:hypothetical protein
MIEAADKYAGELEILEKKTQENPDMMFYYTNPGTFSKRTYYRLVSTRQGTVIGFIEYSLHEETGTVLSITLAHITGAHGYIFGKDALNFLAFLMGRYRKIRASVIVGNPVEKTYDRLARRYGWRVVGIYEKDTLSDDGYHDVKEYEYINRAYKGAL